jgi:hypothetical protein
MALALAPLVVTLTFGMSPETECVVSARGPAQTFTHHESVLSGLRVRPYGEPPGTTPEPVAGPAPRWPDNLRVGVERSDWIVVFVGARFFQPHEIRAEIRDLDGATETDFGAISLEGWAAFQPQAPLVPGHTYFFTLTLLDNAGRASVSRPSIGFVMPRDIQHQAGRALAFIADGNPPAPTVWEPPFVEKLLFFIVDPFVLSFMATGALLRRRRRQHLHDFLAS